MPRNIVDAAELLAELTVRFFEAGRTDHGDP